MSASHTRFLKKWPDKKIPLHLGFLCLHARAKNLTMVVCTLICHATQKNIPFFQAPAFPWQTKRNKYMHALMFPKLGDFHTFFSVLEQMRGRSPSGVMWVSFCGEKGIFLAPPASSSFSSVDLFRPHIAPSSLPSPWVAICGPSSDFLFPRFFKRKKGQKGEGDWAVWNASVKRRS